MAIHTNTATNTDKKIVVTLAFCVSLIDFSLVGFPLVDFPLIGFPTMSADSVCGGGCSCATSQAVSLLPMQVAYLKTAVAEVR